MSPVEKAEAALNLRIERLQAGLLKSDSETLRRFLFQSLVACLGVGEALTDYVKMIGQFAQERHRELKQTHEALSAEHAELLKSGHALLERLKADPTDKAVRKEIEGVQRRMEAVQKNLRRDANALQRELAPSLAMIDEVALSLRRLAEADQIDTLKRAVKLIIGNAQELYRAHPGLPAKEIIDAEAWEESARTAIDEAPDFYGAFASAGHQAMLALDLMRQAVSPTPPQTAEEATERAGEAIAERLKAITARFANG